MITLAYGVLVINKCVHFNFPLPEHLHFTHFGQQVFQERIKTNLKPLPQIRADPWRGLWRGCSVSTGIATSSRRTIGTWGWRTISTWRRRTSISPRCTITGCSGWRSCCCSSRWCVVTSWRWHITRRCVTTRWRGSILACRWTACIPRWTSAVRLLTWLTLFEKNIENRTSSTFCGETLESPSKFGTLTLWILVFHRKGKLPANILQY